jgi:hypothetical protein
MQIFTGGKILKKEITKNAILPLSKLYSIS